MFNLFSIESFELRLFSCIVSETLILTVSSILQAKEDEVAEKKDLKGTVWSMGIQPEAKISRELSMVPYSPEK